MKNIFFLCSLPRAGNTVLGSIINSNKNIKMSPNSICPDIINNLQTIKNSDIFQNFPNHKSLDNVIKNSIYDYYEDWEVDNIIDRSQWGTPGNLSSLKKIIKKPKFIILYRPLVECVCSFAKLQIEDNNYIKENIYDYVLQMMNFENGILGKSIWSITNLIKEKEDYKIFYYKDLVENIDNFLKELSLFINVEIIKPKKLEQFNVNGVYYDDTKTVKNLHKIDLNYNNNFNYDLRKYLSKQIINECNEFEEKWILPYLEL